MRIAALYDVHGNLPALEAVLDEVERAAPDLILFGGDLVLGPMPRETLERVLAIERPTAFIRGNTDRELARPDPADAATLPPMLVKRLAWVRDQLDREQLARVGGWDETARFDIPGLGGTLFCHATPRSDTELFTRATPEAAVREALAGVDARVIVCGHTHMQYDRTVGPHRLANAGSVGMPFADTPGAYWAMLGPDVRFVHTAYDTGEAAARIGASAFPEIERFVAENLIRVPDAEGAVRRFEGMAGRG